MQTNLAPIDSPVTRAGPTLELRPSRTVSGWSGAAPARHTPHTVSQPGQRAAAKWNRKQAADEGAACLWRPLTD